MEQYCADTTTFPARHPLNAVCNRHAQTLVYITIQFCSYCHVDVAVRCSCFQHKDGSSSSSSASASPLPPWRVGVTSLPVVRGRVCCMADMLMLHVDVSSARSIVGTYTYTTPRQFLWSQTAPGFIVGLLMRPEHSETKAKTDREYRECKTETETETETETKKLLWDRDTRPKPARSIQYCTRKFTNRYALLSIA